MYVLGAIIFMGLVWLIVHLTGWGYSDPAYWGVILLSIPASMILAAFTRGKKKE